MKRERQVYRNRILFFPMELDSFSAVYWEIRKKPYQMIFAGVLGSGICNGIMGLSGTVWQMAVVWCVNGLFQSLIWSPIIKLFSDWIPTGSQKKFCVNINSSVPIGTFAAYGLTALIVWKFHWRTVFFFSSLCLAAISLIWFIGSRKIRKDLEENGILEDQVLVLQNKKQADVSMWELVLVSGMIFFCFGLMFQGVLKDGVTTWIPTYIREEYHMESVISIISTTVIPIFNLSGVYLASIANRKIFKSETATSASFFCPLRGCADSVTVLSWRICGNSADLIWSCNHGDDGGEYHAGQHGAYLFRSIRKILHCFGDFEFLRICGRSSLRLWNRSIV